QETMSGATRPAGQSTWYKFVILRAVLVAHLQCFSAFKTAPPMSRRNVFDCSYFPPRSGHAPGGPYISPNILNAITSVSQKVYLVFYFLSRETLLVPQARLVDTLLRN
ncbi:MAG: hypothetical protein ABJ059_14870, partial [Hyphomicrobiales bacterium]